MRKVLFAALALLSACATVPSDEEMRAADYGVPPANYDAIVRSFLNNYLRDPMTAQIQYVGGPVRRWDGFGGSLYGWAVCYRINARNAYGGYVGARDYLFMIRDGEVRREYHRGVGEDFSIAGSLAENGCLRIAGRSELAMPDTTSK